MTLFLLVFSLGLILAFSELEALEILGSKLKPSLTTGLKRLSFLISLVFFAGLWGYGFFLFGKLFSPTMYLFVRLSGLIIVLLGLSVMGVLDAPLMSRLKLARPLKMNKTKNPFLLGFYVMISWLSYLSMSFFGVLLLASGASKATFAVGLGEVFVLGFSLGSYFKSTSHLNFNQKVGVFVKKRIGIGILLIVLGAMVFFGYSSLSSYLSVPKEGTASTEKAPSENAKKSLEPAKPISLKDKDGKLVSLSDYKGKTIFLNFWATWCHACEKEMPDMEALYKDYGKNENEVVFLSVAMPDGKGDVTPDELRAFIKEKGYTFPVLFDEKGEAFRDYGIRALPTTYMITASGEVYGYVPGAMTKEIMTKVIEDTKGYQN